MVVARARNAGLGELGRRCAVVRTRKWHRPLTSGCGGGGWGKAPRCIRSGKHRSAFHVHVPPLPSGQHSCERQAAQQGEADSSSAAMAPLSLPRTFISRRKPTAVGPTSRHTTRPMDANTAQQAEIKKTCKICSACAADTLGAIDHTQCPPPTPAITTRPRPLFQLYQP